MKTLVIGYGNTLRRDDGAGVAAAKRLARECPGAAVVTVQELHPELAENLAGCDMAIFLDASVRMRGVCVTRVLPGDCARGAEGHALTPSGVLGLCRALYGREPEDALLVETPASECGFGERMSEGTLRMIDCTTPLVSELLAGETTPEILLFLTPSPACD
jgi:hydrogenase maturation protease